MLLTVILMVCLTGPSQAWGEDRVSLQLKWFHQFQFAGFYAAKEMGFYAEAGLDVDILEGGPGIKVQEIVAAGEAAFGVLGSELVLHRAKGMDVVALAPVIQHSIRAVIARKDHGIATPHDLLGKRMMLNKNELPEFAAMFLNEGIDITTLPILAKDKTANRKFISGEIDAVNGSIANQPYLFRNRQIPYTLIRPVNYGIDFYGDTLFTTEAFLKKNKEMVAEFVAASLKGWEFAFANPGQMADIILRRYAAKKSRDHLMFEQAKLREITHPDLVEIGHNNPERWHHIVSTYQKLGLVPSSFTLKGFLYSDYIGVEAVWIQRMFWFLGSAGLLFALIFLWNFRLRRTVRRVSAEIIQSRENLKITLDSIGDAVIATDREGRVKRMNPVAEKLTGWTLKEAGNKEITEIFSIIHSKTRQPADNPVDRVLKEGKILGLANHTALVSRDGTEYQISDSGAPIRDDQGRITGVVMVFRDMTEEYKVLERIKYNEKRFRSYLESAPYGIFIADGQGRIMEVNPRLCGITGISEHLLTGKQLGDIMDPGYSGGLTADTLLTQAQAEGESHGEAAILTPSGQTRLCEVNLAGLERDRLLGFVHDISRRKAAEDQVAGLARFPGENPHPVLRVEPDGRIIYANSGSRDLLDYWGTKIGDLVPGQWKERITAALDRRKKIRVEEVYGDICLSLVITPIPDLTYVNIYGMDISDQHRTRQLLKKSEEKYRDLVEGTADLITSVNASGKFTFTNQISEQILGISPEEAKGRFAFDFIHPDDRDATQEWFRECISRRLPESSFENRQVNTKTGEEFFMLWTCNFHYCTDGSFKSVNSVARDITDRKRLEAEKEAAEASLRQASKMEAVGTIAGGIAHDFNNVLGIIIGNTELALEDLPEWMISRENLHEIKTAALRASEVVRQLLSFSRKADQVKKVIHLQPVITESMSLLRSSIPTSVDFDVHMDPDAGPVKADPTQIHQVIINLSTNASHAMEKNGGTLAIRLSQVHLNQGDTTRFDSIPPGNYAMLSISDSGHGIDGVTLTKIFDPYFTTKEVGKGTGMGLSVVMGIVRSHNGAITVDSRPGSGTTVTIVFPSVEDQPIPEDATEQAAPTGTGRILLVDDEPAILTLTKNQLSSIGYEVETQENPLEALEAIRSEPARFDLLITDMTMPHMTGDQLIHDVRRINPDLPVLLCTGYSEKIDLERARELGMDGYLEKPIVKTELARQIKTIMGQDDAQ
ncbi:MAG: PAS domain S-box protein [Desulfobacterales bacterium]|nr:PAS domain S-box protein [Desulfobacterales bacterium]